MELLDALGVHEREERPVERVGASLVENVLEPHKRHRHDARVHGAHDGAHAVVAKDRGAVALLGEHGVVAGHELHLGRAGEAVLHDLADLVGCSIPDSEQNATASFSTEPLTTL